MSRPRLGVVKFASCDGCQLTLLDLEDELLPITDRVEIVEFAEATSARSSGPYDLLLVEGSISTPEQAHEIVELRRQTAKLVTIGACATAGGIQALRNVADHDAWRAAIYPEPAWIESLATATPIADHVTVDAELRGCPIAPGQLKEFLVASLVGRRPQLPDEAVCMECKRAGRVCVVVASGEACLGPVTRTGCGALCPAYARGCYACFGPRESANVAGLRQGFVAASLLTEAEVDERFAGFTAMAPAFAPSASAAALSYREGAVVRPSTDKAARPEVDDARR
ncbi:MAG: oxidoreductase [Candidatus Limnocylindrales bacterium]|jgi:coenzyme F420-reducing hydrogenase gamma subunit